MSVASIICTVFKGKDPEVVYADYISGKWEFMEVSEDYSKIQFDSGYGFRWTF